MHVRTLPGRPPEARGEPAFGGVLDYLAFVAIGSRRPGLRRALISRYFSGEMAIAKRHGRAFLHAMRLENPAYYRRFGLEVVHEGDVPRGTFGAGFVPDSARVLVRVAPVSLHAAARRPELAVERPSVGPMAPTQGRSMTSVRVRSSRGPRRALPQAEPGGAPTAPQRRDQVGTCRAGSDSGRC